MKRFLAPLILLLLIFGGSTSEDSYHGLCSDDFGTARIYADKMQERFGITILIGEECSGLLKTDTLEIGHQRPARSPLLGLLGMKDTTAELKKIEKSLDHYPENMFAQLKDIIAPKGLRILLVDELVLSVPEMISSGCMFCDGSYYNIVLPCLLFDQGAVHHELWHVIESVITAAHPDAFMIWEALNPEGFQYRNDYAANQDEYNDEYFVRGYSTFSALEDRATAVEAVFYPDKYVWLSNHPAITRKINAMNIAMKGTIDFQYDVSRSGGSD